jgi:chemotaxis protein methyltransferase CheR
LSVDAQLEPDEVGDLLESIFATYGHDLRGYAGPSIRRRVFASLAKSGLADLRDLKRRILADREAFERFAEDLRVRVTDMFRDPRFFLHFRTRVVPILLTYPVLNIWHCGCATGEEVYATAIVLTEEGLYERSQIYATDVSNQALRQAKAGVYAADRVAGFAEAYSASGGKAKLTDYYTEAYGGIAFRESLRANVLFFEHNLVTDYVFAEMNVVFCRNVLLYFGAPLRERVVEKLGKSLRPGGFLCLGTSESLRGRGAEAFSVFASAEQIYRQP